ncbi:DMT family transporter [Faecalibacterium sp. An192]|uniref:DMT family transporter n=1 Tax=Faecalibacterium sp. An192 TaxID=1965581 RepID=UPI000B3B0281|nr:DMT family transporter [Faecalibacterium sp. An192]OUP29426.1 EamA family transporter [Faecalibacterium sp. An192]
MDNTASQNIRSIVWALLAAALYAISTPVSKLLLQDVAPTMMAGLLYLGAGIGMFGLGMVRRGVKALPHENHLTRRDLPYTAGMVLLDIAAPICLMVGLTRTTSANASLLNNFEIVATALIALMVFREKISRRLWLAIGLITLSSMILSFEDAASLDFSFGSLFVLAACVCWGFENNCTRMMSASDPLEIVVIKGFGSGLGSLVLALALGEPLPPLQVLPVVLVLGFVAYGLSIFFYVYAQRRLGAAKTSAYYAVAPFIGVLLSRLFLQEAFTQVFLIALAIMMAGAYFASTDA